MSLIKYKNKRNFSKTTEPKGDSKNNIAENCFVIQKHLASHLHYDLRLAINGVLKSWAIPKGPSLNPKDKRLAVATEDHPLEYAKFEGVIPEGQYGAGTVMVWDYGTWEPMEDLESDFSKQKKLHFRLHGKKLKGEWVLLNFRNDNKNWLLIKVRDQYAKTKGNNSLLESNSALTKKSIEEIKKFYGKD